MIEVRATIAFGGLKLGAVVWIDVDDPEMACYLDAGYLVPVGDD